VEGPDGLVAPPSAVKVKVRDCDRTRSRAAPAPEIG
jgi:hypothetical protein